MYKQNNKLNKIFMVIIVSLFIPIVSGIVLNGFVPIRFVSIPLHSLIESVGGVVAIVIALVFYMKYRKESRLNHFNWAAVALLYMGVIDLFHAAVMPGKLFVWLHSIAVFFGGALFISVWFKQSKVSVRYYNLIPLSFLAFALLVSLVSLLFVEYLPEMIDSDGEFSAVANMLNVLGGVGFFIAAAKFITLYVKDEKSENLLFAGHTILFGVAGVLFVNSVVWDMQWWLWHILRLLAYIVALVFLFAEYRVEIEELETYKNELEDMVQEEVKKNKEQASYLVQQSRLAQMGEMISMIAHQWRQPLGSISSLSMDLSLKIELEKYDLENMQERKECLSYFDANLKEIAQHIDTLSITIDDFRNFHKQRNDHELICVHKPVQKALLIIGATLRSKEVEVNELCSSCEFKVKILSNEIMQVVLNILKNSLDNFLEKSVQNPKITISSGLYDEKQVFLSICDNGGGIVEQDLDNLFDPYFSTKGKNGTGLGLYMSKIIIDEHHNGKLLVKNTQDGVCFTMVLKIAEYQ